MVIPTVSVCVPAYSAKQFLHEALESVRAQTFDDWELIVTEDGSDDGSRRIVEELAERVGQRVEYTRHDVNRGLPATRNTGITHARADWIALLDSDDLWTPNHLETCLQAADQTGADLIHAGAILFDSDTGLHLERRAPTSDTTAGLPRSLFDARYCIQPSSVLLKKSLWERAGRFDPAFRYVEDRDMWLRCVRAGGNIAYTGQETCLYRKHGSALTTRAYEMAEANARVLMKHLDWEAIPEEERRRRAAEAWSDAGRIIQRASPDQARRCFDQALGIEWRLKCWLRKQGLRGLQLVQAIVP